MANVSIEAWVEQQQNAPEEQPELQFIVADEWPGECCAPPAVPPRNQAAPAEDKDWEANRCVA